MKIFVPPLKWDKVNDGPDLAGYALWLQGFERSQLPPATIFPRPGQVWQALRDCDVGFVATMESKDSHLNNVQLPNGETIILFGTEGSFPLFPFGRARLSKGEKFAFLNEPALLIAPVPSRCM